MRFLQSFLLAVLLLPWPYTVSAQSEVDTGNNIVIYTRDFADDDYGYYHIKVLEAIFDATPDFGQVTLSPHTHPMSQSRQMLSLLNGEADIMWSVTDIRREQMLIPIKLPLLKGFAGYRVFIIEESAQNTFPPNLSIDELKHRLLVQGYDWPDLHVLQTNGFRAEGEEWSLWFTSMFTMLEKGVVDAFPRNVIEVTRDLKHHATKRLALEQNHLLVYPNYEYFFVRPDNESLARRMYIGLSRILQNGTLDTLFNTLESHKAASAIVDDANRNVHQLFNDNIPYTLDYARWDLHKAQAIDALTALH